MVGQFDSPKPIHSQFSKTLCSKPRTVVTPPMVTPLDVRPLTRGSIKNEPVLPEMCADGREKSRIRNRLIPIAVKTTFFFQIFEFRKTKKI